MKSTLTLGGRPDIEKGIRTLRESYFLQGITVLEELGVWNLEGGLKKVLRDGKEVVDESLRKLGLWGNSSEN